MKLLEFHWEKITWKALTRCFRRKHVLTPFSTVKFVKKSILVLLCRNQFRMPCTILPAHYIQTTYPKLQPMRPKCVAWTDDGASEPLKTELEFLQESVWMFIIHFAYSKCKQVTFPKINPGILPLLNESPLDSPHVCIRACRMKKTFFLSSRWKLWNMNASLMLFEEERNIDKQLFVDLPPNPGRNRHHQEYDIFLGSGIPS